MDKPPITAKLITSKFYEVYARKRYGLVLPNVYLRPEIEADICAVRRSGFLDEIEIKLSYEDFKNDFKKTCRVRRRKSNKHRALRNGLLPPNYFYFALPEDIADQCSIPDYCGLLVFKWVRNDNGRYWSLSMSERQAPKRLHRRKLGEKQKASLWEKAYYRFWQQYPVSVVRFDTEEEEDGKTKTMD